MANQWNGATVFQKCHVAYGCFFEARESNERRVRLCVMDYQIKLDIFEGPLDLLLYLIKKNEIDIYDIPISIIVEQYMEYIEAMKSLNLDLAGEYLVLAATLLHIKSRMLLPVHDDEESEEEGDPRQELVKQLLEYKAFKEAALNLNQMHLLGRDVFSRTVVIEEELDEDAPIKEIGIFELIEAFRQIIADAGRDNPIEIDVEKISLSQRINEIMDELGAKKVVTFSELLGNIYNRVHVIYTFLAILELMKLRLVKAFQSDPYGVIRIYPAVGEIDG